MSDKESNITHILPHTYLADWKFVKEKGCQPRNHRVYKFLLNLTVLRIRINLAPIFIRDWLGKRVSDTAVYY